MQQMAAGGGPDRPGPLAGVVSAIGNWLRSFFP
jgi:hypothetical protein